MTVTATSRPRDLADLGRRDAFAALDDAVAAFVAAERTFRPGTPMSYWSVTAAVANLMDSLARACAGPSDPGAVADAVAPAREIWRSAPLLRHIQTWPRGYAGDFEVIERILAHDVLAEPGTFAAHLEHFLLTSPVAQQHRNKLAHQARLITRTLTARTSPARILLIACGGAADLRSLPDQLVRPDDRFVLHDIDRRALALARTSVGPLVNRCTFVKGNIFQRLDELADHGPFDLVLAGGLFDYLDDAAAGVLVAAALDELVAPGGTLCFSNVAAGHPYDGMLEHLLGWRLIQRDEAGLRALVRRPDVDVTVRPEATRITLIADVTTHA